MPVVPGKPSSGQPDFVASQPSILDKLTPAPGIINKLPVVDNTQERLNTLNMAPKDPATANQVLKLEEKTGLPWQFIEQNLEQVSIEADKQDFDPTLFRQKNPKLSEWFAKNPYHYPLLKEDVGFFADIENAASTFSAGWKNTSNQEAQADLLSRELEGETLSIADQYRLDQLRKESAQLNEQQRSGGKISYGAGLIGYTLGQQVDQLPGQLTGLAVGGITGSAIPVVGTAAGAYAGYVAGGMPYSYKLESAFAFDEYRNLKDLDGNPMDLDTAKNVAKAVGAINTVIEAGSDALFLKFLPGAKQFVGKFTKPLVKEGVKKALAVPTYRAALLSASKTFLASGFTEGAEEILQTLNQALGRETAQAVSGKEFAPDSFWQDFKEAGSAGFEASLGSMLTLGAGASFSEIVLQTKAVQEAKKREKFYLDLAGKTNETNTAKMSPEKAAEAIKESVKDTPVEKVYIDPETWDSFFQSKNVNPEEAAAEILGKQGNAYFLAKEIGKPVEIPTEVYATKIAVSPEASQFFSKELRTEQDGMNSREADEYLRKSEDETAPKIDKKQIEDESSMVGQMVRDQLIQTGMSETEAKANARIWQDFTRVNAPKYGMTPSELYNEIKLNVGKGVEPFTGGNVLSQGERGQVLFGPKGEVNIRFLQDADKSTFMHESSHSFLEILGNLSEKETSTEDGKKQYQDILKWLGVGARSEITREHHEKFARSFETYLMEGKAPTKGLKKAFAQFKLWLTQIYKSIKSLNAPLNPEIRGIFDRLLATEEEIMAAENEQNIRPLILDPIAEGLTEQQALQYVESKEAAESEAESTLQVQAMKDINRRASKEYKAARSAMKDAVKAEANVSPTYRAIAFFRHGKNPDGSNLPEGTQVFKLNKQGLDISKMPKGITSKDGINADLASSFFGFKDGDEMIAALSSAVPYNDYLEQETDRRMAEAYPDFITTDEFKDAAMEAVHNEKRSELLNLELKILAGIDFTSFKNIVRVVAKRADVNKEVLNEAAKMLEEMDLVQIDPQEFLKQERKAADEAATLLSKGDQDGAIQAKKTEALNRAFYLLAVEREKRAVQSVAKALPISKEIKDKAVEIFSNLPVNERDPETFLKNETAARNEAASYLKKGALDLAKEASERATLNRAVYKIATSLKNKNIKKIARRVPRVDLVKQRARSIISAHKILDIKPNQYLIAERKAANEASKLFVSGDVEGAFDAKQREALNHELFRYAIIAQKNIKKGMKRFKEVAKWNEASEPNSKKRNSDLILAGQAVLSRFDMMRKDNKLEAKLNQILKYDRKTYDVIASIADDVLMNSKPITQTTFSEFMELSDLIDSLWTLSRQEKMVEIEGKKIDAEIGVEALVNNIISQKPKRVKSINKTTTGWDKIKDSTDDFLAKDKRMEHLVDEMDKGNAAGVWRTYLWEPTQKAFNLFKSEKAKRFEQIKKILEPKRKEYFSSKKIAATELGDRVFENKAELVGALLHTGNESNLQKLLIGYGWGEMNPDGTLNTSRWDAFVQRMIAEKVITKEDMDLVQSIWDVLEEMKPGAQQAHKEIYGYYFKEIEAKAIVTPWGMYRGGYMPALVDPFKVPESKRKKSNDEFLDNDHDFILPTTGRGFTKARNENYAKPLDLNLKRLTGHVDWVLRFSLLEKTGRDIFKIVNNPAFKSALDSINPHYYDNVVFPWLNRFVQQKIVTQGDLKQLDAVAGWIRSRSSSALLFGSINNFVQQAFGLFPAMTKVKGKYIRNSFYEFLTNRKQLTEDIASRSLFMKNHLEDSALAMAQDIDSIISDSKVDDVRRWISKHDPLSYKITQNMVDVITWRGKYNEEIASGKNEEMAVRAADAAVRLTQGGYEAQDISTLEQGTPMWRLMIQFASYFNNLGNMNVSNLKQIINSEMSVKDKFVKGSYSVLLGYVSVAMLSVMIRKLLSGSIDEDDDDEYLDDFIDIAVWGPVETALPMVTGAGQALLTGLRLFDNVKYNDSIVFSPGVNMSVDSLKTVVNAAKGEGKRKYIVRDSLTLLGLMTNLPLRAVAKPINYSLDVSAGKAKPTGPIDFTRGLLTGRPGPK